MQPGDIFFKVQHIQALVLEQASSFIARITSLSTSKGSK